MGSNAFFNPVKQYVNDFILFKKLVPTQHKTAILMNDNFYKTQKDWDKIIKSKFEEKDTEIIMKTCSNIENIYIQEKILHIDKKTYQPTKMEISEEVANFLLSGILKYINTIKASMIRVAIVR